MILEAIKDQLVANAALGLAFGQNLFLHGMTAEQGNAVQLRYYFGGPKIDHEKPGFYKAAVSIIVRNGDLPTGIALSNQILAALQTERIVRWPGMQVNYVRARTEPFVFPRLLGNNWENAVVYDVCYAVDGT